jgi:hypothetical protein
MKERKNIMNRMKRFIKGSVLLLMMFTMACKEKDVPDKDNKQNVECTKKGTIVGIGCVGNYLGIMDTENNYYHIEEDKTNDFSKYKEGDEICFDFEYCDESTADYSNQGINFTPATSINLTCISDCHCQSDCKRVNEVSELPSDSGTLPTPVLDIVEMRQQGNSLYLKLAFSGCDSDIDPELYLTSMITTGPRQVYDCVVRESRVHLCAAHFVKEVCFNLSDLEKKHGNYELIFQTREGSKPIKIVH